MSKATHFTVVTALPAGITRQTVLETLHSHTEMIDLNPLVIERHPIRPPPQASAEESQCSWYAVRDKINYIPGLYSGELSFNACFHDLPDGMQTHIIAPLGLDMKQRWTLGGTLPGEPRQAVELGLGVPKHGLWLREDVDMKCNFAMTSFVKKTTKKTLATLVERLIEKSELKEGDSYNQALRNANPPAYHTIGASRTLEPPQDPPTPSSAPALDNSTHPPPASIPPASTSPAPASSSYPPRSSSISLNNEKAVYRTVLTSDEDPSHPAFRHLSEGGSSHSSYPMSPQDYPQHRQMSGCGGGAASGSNRQLPSHQYMAELPANEPTGPLELDSAQNLDPRSELSSTRH